VSRTHCSARGSTARLLLPAVLALLCAPAIPAPATAETPHPSLALDPESGLGRMSAYFEANPGLKTTRSSGWKPFQRMLWFAETRSVPEGTTAGILRQRVLEEARTRAPRDAARGAGWFAIGPTRFCGRTTALDFHPTDASIVYVGAASGGLWKSTDGGDTWREMTDDLPSMTSGAVCVLGTDPDIVLLGTGEGSGAGFSPSTSSNLGVGLLKSTDGGETWGTTSMSYPVSGTHGFNVIQDNPSTGTILAGANDGLWRSTDEGDTWSNVQSAGAFFDVKWKPGDMNTVYVAKGRDPFLNSQNNNGIKVSTDDGLTFAFLGAGQPFGPSIAKTKIGVTAADPEVIYAHYVSSSSWGSLGVYRSTDAGATWQIRNNTLNMAGGQGWYNLVLAVDPDDAERVVTAGVQLYVSDDGGVSYTSLNAAIPFGNATVPHWDSHVIAYEPGSTNALWIGNDGGVWRSSDDGDTWASRREGIVSYQYYDICVAQDDPEFVMGGTQDNGIPGRSGADTWFHSTFVADGMVCNINPNNAQRVYAEWQFGNQIKSVDGGQSWSSIQLGLNANGGIWVTPVDEDQNLANHLYTGHNNGIFRTTTGGNFWTNVAPHSARWISISPVDGNTVWTVSNFSAVWVTTDDGGTWNSAAGFPATGLETKIEAHPTDVGTAWVTYGGYGTGQAHIAMTTDLGTTWVDVTGDFPDQPANTFIADPAYPDDWYVGSDLGVWKSTDGGAQWTPVGTGLPNVVVTDLEIRNAARKLVAGTFGRGVWEVDLPPAATGVEAAVAVSPNLMLDPPSPNPVRGQAVFRFAARSEGRVTLEIFDVAGRRVSSLAEVAGDGVVRTVPWVTADVPAGVYFAVLSNGAERMSRKVVVAR